MIVGASAVVVHVRRDQVLRHGFDRVDQIAVDMRVAEIEADADASRAVQIVFDEVHERSGARQLVRDHFDRDLDAERLGGSLQFLDAAPRRRAAVAGAAPTRRATACAAAPGASPAPSTGIRRAMCSACSASATAARARVGVGARERQRRSPAAPREALGDRRVHAVQLESGFREPLLQIGDRRRIVVIEMRPRREQLDRLEPMRRDLEQMVAGQPLSVVEVRRHPELSFRHKPKHLFTYLPQLVDMRRQDLAQPLKPWMSLEVLAPFEPINSSGVRASEGSSAC